MPSALVGAQHCRQDRVRPGCTRVATFTNLRETRLRTFTRTKKQADGGWILVISRSHNAFTSADSIAPDPWAELVQKCSEQQACGEDKAS
jgi:hypothetical protein